MGNQWNGWGERKRERERVRERDREEGRKGGREGGRMLVQDVQDPKGKRDERVRRGIFFKLLMDVVSPLAPPYRGERERGEREREREGRGG